MLIFVLICERGGLCLHDVYSLLHREVKVPCEGVKWKTMFVIRTEVFSKFALTSLGPMTHLLPLTTRTDTPAISLLIPLLISLSL